MGSGFEFNLLGPVEVVRDGVSVPIPGAKQRTLLAALLLEANRVVSGERLIARLWEEDPPAHARNALQNHVKRLRQVLTGGSAQGYGPDPITTRPDGYLISVSEQALDVSRFNALVRRAESTAAAGRPRDAIAMYGEALAQWRGEPLGGISSVSLRGAFAGALTEKRLTAVEARIELELRLGRHEEVLAELAELTAAQPLRERFWEQRLLALYRSGRQAEALTAYQSAAAALAEELGIDPGTTLRELHQAILTDAPVVQAPAVVPVAPAAHGAAATAGAPAADLRQLPVVPRQLPAAARGFCGRFWELGALTALADEADSVQETAPVVVIAGTGGIGKTALAVHWAHKSAGSFPDGQLYINLRGFGPAEQPLAPGHALRGFLDAFGVPPNRVPPSTQAQAALYRSLAAGRRLLVILDNARDADQVRPLLPGSPGCLTVITSRLDLAGLVAIEGAQLLRLDLPTPAEARDLLAARLGAARIGGEPQAVADIVERCARLPLALAVVAARAATRPGHPLASIAQDLCDAPDRLGALTVGDASSDVRTVFSWSYRRLSAPAARLFRMLGTHPGPDVGVPVCVGLMGGEHATAKAALDELTSLHLLDQPAAGRYAMHDLLREFAAELARTVDGEAYTLRAQRLIFDHYLHSAYRADRLIQPARPPIELTPADPDANAVDFLGPAEVTVWYETECEILLAAAAQATALGLDLHAWQLPWAMTTYLDRSGRWHDLTEAMVGSLAALRRLGDRSGEIRTRIDLGQVLRKVEEPDRAQAQFQAALELSVELADLAGQARAYLSLARLIGSRGGHEEALRHSLHAAELYREYGDPVGGAVGLGEAAWHTASLGRHNETVALCTEALPLLAGSGARVLEADTWDTLGFAYHHLGDIGQALRWYRRAQATFTELGERYSLARTLMRLGDVHLTNGVSDTAREHWAESLEILTILGHSSASEVRERLHTVDGAGSRV